MTEVTSAFPQRRNPLFNSSAAAAAQNIIDSTKPFLTAPKSPVTGKLMVRSSIGDIPVWWCPTSRIVLPVAKEE